jgi:AcrR family transcriptional regulator
MEQTGEISPTESKRTYGGVAVTERRALRKQRFLDAGLDLIGSVGYRSMTLRVLCKAAALNDRYFYESFENMEAFLAALYRHHITEIQDQIEALAMRSNGSLPDRVREGIHLYFVFMNDKRRAKLALTEILGVSDAIDALYQEHTSGFAKMLISLLKREFPSVNLGEDAERALGLALAGACTMAATHWMLENYKTPIDVMTQTCTDVFIGTLGQILARPT